MIQASIHGRLTADPVRRITKAGKDMTTVTLAVDVTGTGDEQQTLFVGLLAFNRAADDLARATKGQACTAMGRMTRSTYTPPNGEPRESWTLLADAVLTLRSARPGQRKSTHEAQSSERRERWERDGDGLSF